jgi:hypothetical protein
MLVLLNGAPGVGKSSLADRLVRQRPMMLALDVDGIKHALGRWEDDAGTAGRHARRLAVALIREQLAVGYDVVVAQYLARTDFIEELERVSADSGARSWSWSWSSMHLPLRSASASGGPTPTGLNMRSTTASSTRRTHLGSLAPSTQSKNRAPKASVSTPPARSQTLLRWS